MIFNPRGNVGRSFSKWLIPSHFFLFSFSFFKKNKKKTITTPTPTSTRMELAVEDRGVWPNYTGFLCAMGGVCLGSVLPIDPVSFLIFLYCLVG